MDNFSHTITSHFTKAFQLHRTGRLHEALACYQLALQDGVTADILLNVGALLHELARHSEALEIYQQALKLAPLSPRIHHNRGNTLLALDRCEEAVTSYRQAATLLPDSPEPLVPMGMALERLLRHDEAMECYHVALTRDPGCAEAHWNKALLHLKLGQFEKGWDEFKWRWQKKGYTTQVRDFGVPVWNGEALDGKSILVHTEQAFGDTFQFARYLPLVAARCGYAILEAPLPLCELLHTMPAVSEVIPTGSPIPRCDRHIPLMSLPGIFGTTVETIPGKTPYIIPPEGRLDTWKRLLAPYTTFKAGIVWAGRKEPDPRRSCSLTDLAPLATIRGITFFSLQMGDAANEISTPPPGMEIVDLTANIRDFADTAAFIAHLDLVITIDTSVAHLSGAMGKPTFVLLPYIADWRWMLERADSPWYSTLRLYRQTTRGSWLEPVKDMVLGLGRILAGFANGAYQSAMSITPAVANRYEIAVGLMDKQCFDEAEELLVQIIQEASGWSTPIVLLGLNCYHKGNDERAEQYFRQAIALDSECTEAYRSLGLLLNEQERFGEAVSQFLMAISLAPNDVGLLRSLADALNGEGNIKDACQWYRKTLSLQPDDVETLINLGAANELLNQFKEAEQSLLRAIELAPQDYRPYLNLGGVFLSQNRLENAERCFQKALEYRPDDATIRWNLAQVALIRGNYRDGFREFETRFDKKNPVRVNLCGLPLWDGSSLTGKTLLVITEQAFGDTLQFCRFLPVLAKQGGRVLLLNNLKPLDKLLASLPFTEQVITPGEPLPKCDWAVPMLSIPYLMNTTLENIPASTPYLFPDIERCLWWKKYLEDDSGFKVGIAWRGRRKPDPRRSAELSNFAVLNDVPGISWYSLQVSEGEEVLTGFPAGVKLNDPTALLPDFSETAALMSQLDLVISIDSAVAHLAGALGRPTWLLLPYSPDWRWMLGRDDSPWYPTMRLFRQPSPGAWEAVFAEVASALDKLLLPQ
jgi:tetratricopeptide (TPR) repeat protein